MQNKIIYLNNQNRALEIQISQLKCNNHNFDNDDNAEKF